MRLGVSFAAVQSDPNNIKTPKSYGQNSEGASAAATLPHPLSGVYLGLFNLTSCGCGSEWHSPPQTPFSRS